MIDVSPEHIERIIEGAWHPDTVNFIILRMNFIVWIFQKKRMLAMQSING